MINQPRALALVGMPGAGKTLCATYLANQGFFQFRFGGIVTDEVTRRGWEINPANERVVREELRANEGMDVMAKRALPHLKAALENHNCVIIDGLYSFSEYKLLRPEFGDAMFVVAIFCPRSLRYERLTTRTDRPLTMEQAIDRDYSEIEYLEKGGPIALADYTLINDGGEKALLQKLDDLLDDLDLRP